MNIIRKISMFSLVAIALLGFISTAHASAPVLSLSNPGSINSVLLSVNGNPNSPITLYYTLGSGTQTRLLGDTNNNGFFSTILDSSDYLGINAGSSVYVVIDGQQSSYVPWPSSSSGLGSSLSLSQTNINPSVGQSTTITAYNAGASLYVSSNSNPSVATTSVSGNSVLIYSIANGTSTIVICENGLNICNSVYVTVGYNSGSGSLSLSQTSLSLSTGQTSTITAYNSAGSLYVSSNSNPGVATTSVNGNTVSVYASGSGSTTLTVCQSNISNSCSTVYITVNGYQYQSNNSNLNFSISTLTIPVGGSATISASSYGLYSIMSGNSNPNVASVSTSYLAVGCVANALYSTITGQPCLTSNGSSLIVSALAPGSTTLTLCQQNQTNLCGSISVTVTNSASPITVISPANPISPSSGFSAPVSCSFSQTLRLGMTGDSVYCLQLQMYGKGYLSSGNLNAIFDTATFNAVILFQQNSGLVADGIVGANTRARLF